MLSDSCCSARSALPEVWQNSKGNRKETIMFQRFATRGEVWFKLVGVCSKGSENLNFSKLLQRQDRHRRGDRCVAAPRLGAQPTCLAGWAPWRSARFGMPCERLAMRARAHGVRCFGGAFHGLEEGVETLSTNW